jgi:hypothetical protein
MRKGKISIVLGFIFLVCILFYMAFISKNPYLNELLFFFGGMITICFFAYGCDKIEKNGKETKKK